MTRTKVIFIVSFLLAFAAGTSLGVLVGRPNRPSQHHSWLTSELSLTAEQRDQMSKIWSQTVGSVYKQQGEMRSALSQERDQAIRGLLSETQRTEYEAILQRHSRKMEELSQERKRAFEESVERTRKILTPSQAARYEELMKKQRERGSGQAGSPFRGPRHRHSEPASAPTTSEPSAPHGGD